MDFETIDKFQVDLGRLTSDMLDDFEVLLDQNLRESEYQRFLTDNPAIVARLMGHESAWLVPEKALGAEFRCDFMVAELNSGGFHWEIVELKRPRDKVTNRQGGVSQALNIALTQIRQRRDWLEHNLDYARRPRSESGLGLEGIRSQVAASIIIGRESGLTDACKALRRRVETENRIRIMTFDRLLRWARKKVSDREEYLERLRKMVSQSG